MRLYTLIIAFSWCLVSCSAKLAEKKVDTVVENSELSERYSSRFQIEKCSYDYGFVDYCDEEHYKVYQNIINIEDKSIIYNKDFSLFLLYEDGIYPSLIALNTKTNNIIPLPYTFTATENAKIFVNLRSNIMCFKDAELEAYKDIINGELVCFTLENNNLDRNFFHENDNVIEKNQLLEYKIPFEEIDNISKYYMLSYSFEKIVESKNVQKYSAISLSPQDYIITNKGIGDIALGDYFDIEKFNEAQPQAENVDNCIITSSKNYPKEPYSLSFQFVDNLLVSIHLSNYYDPAIPFKSYTGVKVGDTIDTVYKLHKKQPDEMFNNIYTDEPILVYWTDSSKKVGMRYDMHEGKVLSMSLNYNQHIQSIEGCA